MVQLVPANIRNIYCVELSTLLYKVQQFNSRNGRSVSLGCRVRQTHVPKHVWICSNLRFHEPQTKLVVRSPAAEEVVRVRGILLAEKNC
jgi:hypothetical protein